MESKKYADLLASGLEPERFVRELLRLLEADLRVMALTALADWARLEIVLPRAGKAESTIQRSATKAWNSLFLAISALQRPSWRLWKGLMLALRSVGQAPSDGT